MYKVIKSFSDLQDGGFVYRAGDAFPRLGKDVTRERVAELSSANNKRKEALIRYEEEQNKSIAEETETISVEKKRKRKNARADSQVD